MRNPETTKHDYGHALLVAGAFGRMGCAVLAARAALRSGCGLLTAHLPARCVDAMQAAFPEAMVSIDPDPVAFSNPPDHLDRYAAIALGPGLGTLPATAEALRFLLVHRPAGTPTVLDADALNLLAAHTEWLPLAKGCILTPHAGEYRRLFGETSPAAAAAASGTIIVAKAHHTLVVHPDGRSFTNTTGNAAMATAGSGDVLTGILLGMLSANRLHTDTFDIVCQAVKLHGILGDLALSKQSESSLIASDLVENLRHVSTDMPSNYNK